MIQSKIFNFTILKIMKKSSSIMRKSKINYNNLDLLLSIVKSFKADNILKIIKIKMGNMMNLNQNYMKMFNHSVSLMEEKIDNFLKKNQDNLII